MLISSRQMSKKQQSYVMQTVKHASAKIRGMALGLARHFLSVTASNADTASKQMYISSNFLLTFW